MKTVFTLILISTLSVLKAQDLNLYLKKEYKAEAGTTLPYRILYPENYDKTKKYPLILFLHGAGERGNNNEKQLTHGKKLFLTDQARKNFPCIVIFPQCPEESYWSSVNVDRTKVPLGLDFDYTRSIMPPLKAAIELVKTITDKEGVDKKRIYVTGLSMGGMGTFEAVYRYPKLFAAALPICGGGDAKRYDKRVKKIPFWVFHGGADKTVDVNCSREMVEKLKTIGAKVRYSEYPGVGHNSWNNTFAEPDFLSWMFSNKRK
ncbi:MAG: prolyl oligopeptidase family serine peptidase [Bacteroidetes bacterium]|nr:prolyl oligopeptidase family serine peptidase [Bacteroidota bacterium]